MSQADHTDILANHTLSELEAELYRRGKGSSSSPAPMTLLATKAAAGAGGAHALLRELAKEALSGVPIDVLFEAVRERQKLIYDHDDRQDHFDILNSQVKRNAESVVAIIDASRIEDLGDGTSRLLGRPFKQVYSLCSKEPFREQPVVAGCTGFLVAEDIIATAGHCVKVKEKASLDGMRFVFGFRMTKTEAVTVVPNSEIYRYKAVVGHELTDSGTDWSLVRLDRRVTGHPICRLQTAGKIADNTRLYVLGHPCGLPLKYAPSAHVRGNAAPAYFSANLDTYGGNSGSPVFNEQTHEVEGILVRGGTDFVKVGNCNRSLVIAGKDGEGEDVTRISEVLPKLSGANT